MLSLLITGWLSVLAFLFCAGAWMWAGGRRRGAVWAVLPVLLTATALATGSFVASRAGDPARFEASVRHAYESIWQGLDTAAERTATRLSESTDSLDQRLAIFRTLEEEAATDPDVDVTLLLVDAEGEVVSWGGEGLLHEVESARIPEDRERSHITSFSAVTLLSSRPVKVDGRSWRLVAGTSLRTDSFPFHELQAPLRWSVVPAAAPIADGFLRARMDHGPDLVYEVPTGESRPTGAGRQWRLLAALIWGFALLALAWQRGFGWKPLATPRDSEGLAVPVLCAASGLGLVAKAADAPIWAVALIALAGASAAFVRLRGAPARSLPSALGMGALGALVVPLVGFALLRFQRLPQIGGDLWQSGSDLVSRLAIALSIWVVLSCVRSVGMRPTAERSAPLVLVFASLLGAALLLESFVAVLVLSLVAGVASAFWVRSRTREELRVTALVLALIASLMAAIGWETVARRLETNDVRRVLMPAMAPPSAAEIQSLADAMEAFLGSWDPASIMPAGIEGVRRQDLAFEIWQQSPLSDAGGLSAIRVLPEPGGLSSFSYGLPLNEERWVDWGSPLLRLIPTDPWESAVIVGDGWIRLDGEAWAYAEYALTLQPGFRLQPDRQGDLAEVLLRAGPGLAPLDLLDLGGVRYGLWDREGRSIVAPWPVAPELPEELKTEGEARLSTPEGHALAVSAAGEDGLRVLFLIELSAAAALERVGIHALPVVLVLVLLFVVLEVPSWLAKGLEALWSEIWYSYSRRLVLVYSLLLLLPLAVVNYLIVRAVEEGLVREQQQSGLRALESAQGVLGEYVLTLKPGFGLDSALDDERLRWLSNIVHHDVNLYWRGSVYASSKSELFTAGLLPGRIPGEIYAGLTLRGHAVSMRAHRTGDSEYLELYAPLAVPGVATSQTRLIVSLPQLAQQQQTAQQIGSLRRRTLLGSAVVVSLIVAIGWRLARRFTAPLTEIVEGTQRIAAGASALELRPVELELATLVEAIDQMAARIHRGREELLREKRLVDRVVENITAGVISLDQDRRVLMANRAAVELTGLQIGEMLDRRVGSDERLAPLAAALPGIPSQGPSQHAVTLQDLEGNAIEWTVVWVPLPGEGEPSALLVLEDVTEVLRGQRLQAWAEMARMIAHEIKNPLTPIRLSAEHMREIHARDPDGFDAVFESCTANILHQVDELQAIAGEFSTYSRIPRCDPQPVDLVAVIRKVVDGYRAGLSKRIDLRLESEASVIDAVLDAKLVGRAVRNLIENALRVSAEGGEIVVRIDRRENRVTVSVADEGPGVDEALLKTIFDPYFSTHDSGTGLGLPIARRIAEEHGGEIRARNRSPVGLEVELSLPVDPLGTE